MFNTEHFPAGSFVMMEGKLSEHFYIIKSGKVQITNQVKIATENSNAQAVLGPGDFFGVISCMSGHTEIETVVALENVSLICVKRANFGILIQKNPSVAMKIIRFFSNQLRDFNNAITNLTFKDNITPTPSHLFNIGKFYMQKKSYNHAVYVFQKFIKHYPYDHNVSNAKQELDAMNAPHALPEDASSNDQMIRAYIDNSIIFSEHEPGRELYIIKAGKVKITRITNEEILLTVLNPGDIFGEMALLDSKPRSATATAFGTVTLMAINKENFEKMVQEQPQLVTKLIQLLSERIWTSYRQLDNLMIKDEMTRIWDMLLIQVEKRRIKIDNKVSFSFDFGAKELMNMVGIQGTQAEIRAVHILDDKNMRLENGKLFCTDIMELYKTVTFRKKQEDLEKKREKAKNQIF